jgi:hypothetical protein
MAPVPHQSQKDAAATRIQAAHRGRRTRQKKPHRSLPSKKLQAGRAAGARRGLTRDEAALRIQCAERGKRGRQRAVETHAARVRGARKEKEWLIHRHDAATRIQATHRGKRGRRKAKKHRKAKQAAQLLQPEPQREPVDVAAFNAGKKNAPFCAILYYKSSFCQDRLGTNIGKLLKKEVCFQRSAAALRCSLRPRRAGAVWKTPLLSQQF